MKIRIDIEMDDLKRKYSDKFSSERYSDDDYTRQDNLYLEDEEEKSDNTTVEQHDNMRNQEDVKYQNNDFETRRDQLTFTTKQHPRVLINKFIAMIAAVIALLWIINKVGQFIVKDNYASLTLFYIMLILATIAYLFLYPWLRWATTTYTFDKTKIVIRWGILTKNINTISFKWIINFYILQNLNDKMFKTGTLLIELSNGEEIRIDLLPDIKNIENYMNRAIDRNSTVNN